MEFQKKARDFTQKRLPYVLAIYVMLQPILDILTSLCARGGLSITPGILVRTLLMGYAFFHVVFISRFRSRKWCLLYVGVLTVFLLLFFAYMATVNTLGDTLRNVKETIKVFFFPYVAVYFYAIYREHGFTVTPKALAIAVGGYAGSIFLAFLTGTGFASYNSGYGCNGWFYAANEISDTLVITAPIAICFAIEQMEHAGRRWKPWLAIAGLLIVCAFASNYIGTKVIFAGVLFYFLLCTVWLGVAWLRQRKKNDLMRTLVCLCAALLTLGLYGNSALNSYVTNIYLPMEDEESEQSQASINQSAQAAAEGTWLGNLIENDPLVERLNWILSKRLLIIAPSAEEYRTGDAATKLLGLGYQNNELHQRNIERLVEMDAAAILLRHGALGFAVYYLPYLLALAYLVVQFFRRMTVRMGDLRYCSYLYSVLMAFAVSFITGHTLVAPAVSFFVAFLLVNLLAQTEAQDAAVPRRRKAS